MITMWERRAEREGFAAVIALPPTSLR